jgi:hypothetical protein
MSANTQPGRIAVRRFLQVGCVAIAVAATGYAADDKRPLSEAIADFNARAAKNEVGKVQPPLSEAEVIAAIRGWDRTRIPVADETYSAFQDIAETGLLPPGAHLRFLTRWTGFKHYDFDVWWADLVITTGERKTYTYRIRDQKIASRPSVSKQNP